MTDPAVRADSVVRATEAGPAVHPASAGAAGPGGAAVRAGTAGGVESGGAAGRVRSAGEGAGRASADAAVRPGSADGVDPSGGPDRAARVWRALLALVLEKNDRRRQASDALELSYIKVKALRQLASSPLSMRDLTSTLASDAPYTTLVVDELERRGFAERRVNPTDRRSKLVSLTADGQRAAALAESIMTDPPDGFRALPVGDLGHLERIVTRLGGFD